MTEQNSKEIENVTMKLKTYLAEGETLYLTWRW